MNMFRTLVTSGVFATASLAGAAEFHHNLRVNVPFAFVVAGQQFAPGQYEVKESNSGLIIVQGGGQAAAVLSTPGENAKTGDVSKLSFTSDNSREYLIRVAVEGEQTRNVTVPALTQRKLTLGSR